ncbi:MAG TPA: WxL domain-containing protein [Chloroflexia bacterium]|jgi:hypothetical protein
MFHKRFRAFILALSVFAMMAPAAFASDGTQAVVTGGTLSITNPLAGDFTPVTLNGTEQSPTAALAAFTVTDPRGTGAGWHVTAQASQFANAAATRSLAAGSLEMSEPTVAANGTNSPEPDVTEGPYVIDNGSAVSIASAALDEGMGAYDFSNTTLTLAVPADAYAATYLSTVTISVVTAP